MERCDMEDYGVRFRKELERIINQIPEGCVARISDIARAMGDLRASRAIAGILKDINGPIWRVVREDMSIIDERIKKELRVENGIAMAEIHRDFISGKILKELRREQEDMLAYLNFEDHDFNSIAGVDVAYLGNRGFVGVSLFKVDGKPIGDFIHETEITFPYIPTYLSYREGKAMIEAIERAPFHVEAIMVDGNGALHPRHLGIASYIGIKLKIPSIGVAKSLLCGELMWSSDNKGEIIMQGKSVGCALIGPGARNPVYISPGNMISPERACEIAENLMKHRIPEPTRRAHRIAGEFRDRMRDASEEWYGQHHSHKG